MTRCAKLAMLALAVIGMVFPAGGCVFAADALNPELLTLFGLDPTVVFPARGTAIIQFQNDTDTPAVLNAFQTANPNDLAVETRNFSLFAEAGASRNQVLECPIGAVSLGRVEGDAEPTVDAANAVLIVNGANAEGTAVAYAGSILIAGVDFDCGDVISVTVRQIGGDANFQITVQVLPGR